MKTKRVIISIIIGLCSLTTLAQEKSIAQTIPSLTDSTNYLINKTKLSYYPNYIFDKVLIEFVKDKKDRFIAYKNGVPVDTLTNEKFIIKNYIDNFFRFNTSILIMGRTDWGQEKGDTLGIYEFNTKTDKFSLKFSITNFWTSNLIGDEFWGYVNLVGERKKLFKLSASNFKSTKVIDLKPFISERSEIAEIFNFNSGSKLLIMTGEGNADGFDSTKFFVFDTKNNLINEVTEKFKKYCWLQNENNTWMSISDEYSSMFQGTLFVYGSGCEKQQKQPFLMNENIEIVEQSLITLGFLRGTKYSGEKLIGLFTDSQTDNKKDVLVKIPEIPTLTFTRLLKKMNTGQILIEADLKSLSKYSLTILKNFIYAKYNYEFADPYWEAYSNQYSFYSEFYFKKKMPRERFVDDLFSASDKQNVLLVNKYLQRAK